MDTPLSERDPLEELAEEFTSRLRRGEDPSIEEFTQRHPKLAEDIRELFPTLRTLEAGPRDRRRPRAAFDVTTPPPERLGDFRLLWEVGRGGMGLVYEAIQESLGRHVALKLLPPEVIRDRLQLERFQREAQTVARLHHPHIVPVFGVGAHQGIHYYAMQFIDGVSLDKVLRQRRERQALSPQGGATSVLPKSPPTPSADPAAEAAPDAPASDALQPPRADDLVFDQQAAAPVGAGFEWITQKAGLEYFRQVAELGRQAAEGLDYAHGQGVIHRDLKPANLLVDRQGHLWIADFGLAKVTGTGELTSPGHVVGTLRYLAPERLSGETTTASDLYSLGATLYELLACRPLFPDKHHEPLIQKIVRTEPARLRTLEPLIPADLENIIHKLLAKEPERRYASARDLAEDLHRSLEHRPTRARRPGVLGRTVLWARRNPLLAAATASLFFTLSAGLAAAVLLWLTAEGHRREAERRLDQLRVEQQQTEAARQRAEAERQRAEDQRQRAEAEWQRAEASLAATRRAVNEWFITVSENQLLNVPGLAPLRRELLAKAQAFFEDFLREQGDRTDLQAELAQAHFRLGRIHMDGGDRARAREHFAAGTQLYERVAAETMTFSHRFNWALCLNGLGIQEAFVGESEVAANHYTQALKILTALRHEQPDEHRVLIQLAQVHGNWALLQSRSGISLSESLAAFDTALKLLDELPLSRSLDRQVLDDRAGLQSNKGSVLHEHGRYREAVACLEPAVQHMRAQMLARRGDQRAASRFASGALIYALSLVALRRTDEAEPLLKECQQQLELLIESNPDVLDYQVRLAKAFMAMVKIHESRKEWLQAETAVRAALEINQRVAIATPGDRVLLRSIGLGFQNLGVCCQELGRYAESLEAARQAEKAFLDILKDEPRNAACLSFLASTYTGMAVAQRELGDHEAMLAAYRQAIDHSRQALELQPNSGQFRNLHVGHYCQMSTAQARLGRFADALQTLEQAKARIGTSREAALRLARQGGANLNQLLQRSPGEQDLDPNELRAAVMGLWRRAVALGHQDPAVLRRDAALAGLRDWPEFEELLRELERKP